PITPLPPMPPTHPDLLRNVSLYLVGMMGAGKSTLGKRLAAVLKYRFFDTDTLIEQTAQRSIGDIFAEAGESTFRDLETAVIRELAPYTRIVVSTGGGMVLRRENWGHLRQGVVVWVDVPLRELENRLALDRGRPLLQRPDWRDHLATLLSQRQALYREADLHLQINPGESVEESCDRMITLLQSQVRSEPTRVRPANGKPDT
ncbi:shikimate kinase, partial [Leptolyngbya sp. PCC 6406]|uniref:shikimate kinase n=1 Tax=Leptolyngbya sp. PCC 6406 TaxID=1173264 RepID=UPI0028F42843